VRERCPSFRFSIVPAGGLIYFDLCVSSLLFAFVFVCFFKFLLFKGFMHAVGNIILAAVVVVNN
jgi:hypothetical protein